MRSALCILKSEMDASVTTNNAGTPKQIRSIIGEALYCGFHICKTTCLLDLYFGSLWGKIFLKFFTPKGTVLDKELSLLLLPLSDSQNNAGDLHSLLKMCRLDCLLADASSAQVTAQCSVSCADPWVPSSIRDVLVKG